MVDVLRYGERLKTPGLNLLSAPGNDAVATSAGGCGLPYGAVQYRSRHAVRRLCTDGENRHQQRTGGEEKHWIDFDAGQLIHGKAMPQLLEEFIDTIVEFANGKQTCNERNDFRELAIFKSGVTL